MNTNAERLAIALSQAGWPTWAPSIEWKDLPSSIRERLARTADKYDRATAERVTELEARDARATVSLDDLRLRDASSARCLNRLRDIEQAHRRHGLPIDALLLSAELDARATKYVELEANRDKWFARASESGRETLEASAENAALRERLAKLEAAAKKSFALNCEMIVYPDAYFRQKWGFEETLAEIAAELGEPVPQRIVDT
jgi:hypothetical protein